MGKITVSLNSTPTGVYRPGETISGTVNVNLEKPLAATKLVAMLHGEVNVKSASKTYLDCEEDLWNKTGTQSNAQATLAAGSHTFPFSFHLPARLPSTIEGEKMFIRYRIKAKMYRKRGENYSDTKDFPLCSFLDMKPNLLESVSKEDQTMIGGRFSKTGPVILRVTLAKTAYEPGESIMIGPTVENNSKKSFTVLIANLCQHRVVLGGTVQKSSKAVAALVFDDGAVNAGETRTWSHEKMLFIPTDLPPTTHCELFNLDYSVDLILKGCDLVVSVPIVLGWKPPSSSVSEPKSGAKKSSVGDCEPKDERKLSESKQSKQDDGPEQQPKPRPRSREQQTRDTHEDAPVASRRVSQEGQPQPQPRRTSQGRQDQSSNIYPHYPPPPQAQHPPPPHAHPTEHSHPHGQHPPPPRAQRPPSFSEHPPYQHPPPPSAQHSQHPQYSPPYPPSQHPPPPHAQHPPPPRAQRPPSFSEHPPYQHPPPPSAQHSQNHQFSPPYPPSQHPPPPHAPPPQHHVQHPPPPHAQHPPPHHVQHPPPPHAQHPPPPHAQHPPPPRAQHPPPPPHAQHPPPPPHVQHPPPPHAQHPHHAQYPPYHGRHSADFPNERHSYNPDYQQPSAPTAPPADQDWDYRRH
ncbi:uncharacterized protein [Oscarella lobularis]|uniref:uncharacterized protein n=1 Tax=Oscarella lobularis TaxID=121494 RepID=UPI0033139034